MPRGKGLFKLKGSGVTETLIELVKQHPMIYDMKSEYHRDTRVMGEIWCQITEALQVPGLTVKEVKVRWRTLRDSYIKKKKELAKISDGIAGIAPIRWRYMSVMHFLDPYIMENSNARTSGGGVSSEDQDEGDKQQIKEAEMFLAQVKPEEESCSSTSSVHLDLSELPGGSSFFSNVDIQPDSRKRKSHTLLATDKDTDEEFKKSFVELVKLQSQLVEGQQQQQKKKCDPQRCPVDMFFESCALRTKTLSKEKQGWLQVEVANLLYAAECSDSISSVSRVNNIQSRVPGVQTIQPSSSVSSSASVTGLDLAKQALES